MKGDRASVGAKLVPVPQDSAPSLPDVFTRTAADLLRTRMKALEDLFRVARDRHPATYMEYAGARVALSQAIRSMGNQITPTERDAIMFDLGGAIKRLELAEEGRGGIVSQRDLLAGRQAGARTRNAERRAKRDDDAKKLWAAVQLMPANLSLTQKLLQANIDLKLSRTIKTLRLMYGDIEKKRSRG